ncbi:iron-containing alcohol dehydrogenase [Saccharicrinis sp. FJH54]|uniref:iron-containing alcohol dehydrogenase n=1 Tax=Saccharicrinis sp. FJH54 TaxID=3344665 RepID=UPI0035D40E7A
MDKIIIQQPPRVVFGDGALTQFSEDFLSLGLKRLYLLTITPVLSGLEAVTTAFGKNGVDVRINTEIEGEPTFNDFLNVLEDARRFGADSVAGIGGGSVLDVAKFLAAMLKNDQDVTSVVGIGLLKERKTYLACLPTTSGTGSEVSPNAIFLDESDGGKKGVISPFLVPDAAYVDPALTVGVPSLVTAATGIDALTHCIEAYMNRYAHPVVDVWALEGIKLISKNLEEACRNGENLEARTAVALGSMYGGLCLGPVNTAAVHALAYPLGSQYKVTHGLSNALLLSYVLEYNRPEGDDRLAHIAIAMGIYNHGSLEKQADAAIGRIREIIETCNLPSGLSEINIKPSDIEIMADGAIKVQRLLKNNIKTLNRDDIIKIYQNAM